MLFIYLQVLLQQLFNLTILFIRSFPSGAAQMELKFVILILLLLVNDLNSMKFINYDDFQMKKNLIVNWDFSNPKISTNDLVINGGISGWGTRTVNMQLWKGTAFNSNWPANSQLCELVSNRQSIIYQELVLKESYYLLRFDYACRQAYDPKNSDFYVYLNTAQIIYIKPFDELVRKRQIIIKAIDGTNVIQFMGMERVANGGAGIGNVQLFALNNEYPNQIEAVALGSTVTDSDHIAQNYLLDFYPVDKIQGWCAESCFPGAWIQISSPSIRQWKSVITQGRGDQNSWITKYKVAYTLDGMSWKYAQNDKIFSGNTDRNTKIVNTFSSFIYARALRIIVVDFFGNPCARIGATFIQNEISSSF